MQIFAALGFADSQISKSVIFSYLYKQFSTLKLKRVLYVTLVNTDRVTGVTAVVSATVCIYFFSLFFLNKQAVFLHL